MNKFKVGDKVRCINGFGAAFTSTQGVQTGKEYIVRELVQEHGIFVEGIYCWGSNFRFELVEEAKPSMVFKIGSFYRIPNTGTYTYKCCGFTSIGLPLFENPNGHPVAIGDGLRPTLVEYVKPIEVGSKVRLNHLELTVTAIHGNYAWCHTTSDTNMHGGPGGMIIRLDKLRVI